MTIYKKKYDGRNKYNILNHAVTKRNVTSDGNMICVKVPKRRHEFKGEEINNLSNYMMRNFVIYSIKPFLG